MKYQTFKAQVITLLEELQPMKASEFFQAFPHSCPTVTNYICRAVREGAIVRVSRGHYGLPGGSHE